MRKTVRCYLPNLKVELENDGQRLLIDIDDVELEARTFRSDPNLKQRVSKTKLFPTLQPMIESTSRFVSASMLAMKAKSFDDGLYARIDLMAHEGVSTFAGKRHLVAEVLRRVVAQNPADTSSGAVILAAACLRGGSQIEMPQQLRNLGNETLAAFDNSFLSKPLGFYAWSRELVMLFQHDRILQSPLPESHFSSVLSVVKESDDLKRAYLAYLNLVSKLTNPLSNCGLANALSSPNWAPSSKEISFFPPSRSHETELMDLVMNDGKQITQSLIDELLTRVKTGSLQLLPKENSGWYDWQLYALEPLAILERMPEAKHLHATAKYRKRLDDLFKGLYALTRETHVKQLEMTYGAAMPLVTLVPDLRVEPLPSFYLRRASSYAYIRFVLQEIFTAEELCKVGRVDPEAPPTMNLWDEMAYMENLFLGAHAVACEDLGMKSFCNLASIDVARLEPAKQVFLDWRNKLNEDPDVSRDSRMMVPVAVNNAGDVQVWCFLGWSAVKLKVSFDDNWRGRVIQLGENGKESNLDWDGCKLADANYYAAYPVMCETWIRPDKVMIRTDFRAHCDRFANEQEIIAALSV